MKKILVPVDFSEHTETVCRFALEIAKKWQSEIRLFHAYFDYIVVSNSSFPDTVDTTEMFNQEMLIKIKQEATKDMQQLENKLVDEVKKNNIKNVKIVNTLTGGIPEDEILNIAETYQPDIIVMGTRGKGEKEFLTGKISSKVIRHAPCPILTIPRNASGYHGFDNVMYATDLSDESTNDLQRLFDYLVMDNPVIHVVHVDVNGDHQADSDKINALKEKFDGKLKEGKLLFRVITSEDFVDGINDYVETNKIDVIAVVHHRKSFLKRLVSKDHTHELLVHSMVPLFVFPGAIK
jgi:nucleotide-binding universal stress UspA family protein